jgi:hypothetical protein
MGTREALMLLQISYTITCFFIGWIAGTTTRANVSNPWIGYPLAIGFTLATINVLNTVAADVIQ